MSTSNQMGEFITLDEASEMTARYRNSIQPGETIAFAVSKEILTKILDQSNCEGIRLYYGLDINGLKTLVINGLDSSANDIYNGLIADKVSLCPVFCSSPNPLNS